VRFTQDVDLVLRREDLDRAGEARYLAELAARLQQLIDTPDG
jgi:hypothetical protein